MSEEIRFSYYSSDKNDEKSNETSVEQVIVDDALLAGDIAEAFFDFLVRAGWSDTYRLRLTSGTSTLYDSDAEITGN